MLLLIKSPSFALEKPLVLYEAEKWLSFFCLFSGVGFLEDFSLRSPLPNASVQDFFPPSPWQRRGRDTRPTPFIGPKQGEQEVLSYLGGSYQFKITFDTLCPGSDHLLSCDKPKPTKLPKFRSRSVVATPFYIGLTSLFSQRSPRGPMDKASVS